MNNRRKRVIELVEGKVDIFKEASDKIWEYAEMMFEEVKSSALHAEILEKQGFTVERNVAGMETALIASYGKGHPIIAVLGEYDALSALSQEADNIERSPIVDGQPGHGCGHNLLGCAALAAATAVKDYMVENNLKGTIRYYGCPAEEGGSGKGFMIREGAFDDVDIALSWHPAPFNYVWDGSDSLGILQTIYSFKGIASHAAATPHLGRSALDAVELMNVGANFLREHVVPEARIHYAITNSGGKAPNVVQAEAEVVYVVRAPRMSDVYDIAARVDKIAEGAAIMTETKVSKRVVNGVCNLRATKTVFNCYEANLRAVIPVEYTEDELAYAKKFKDSLSVPDRARMIDSIKKSHPDKSMEEVNEMLDMPMPNYYCRELGNAASSDAGDVTWVVPGCQLHVACYPAGTPFHSWQMVAMGKSAIAHKGMATAAKVIAMTALDFITDEELVIQAKKDFETMMGGEKYKCPLPDELKPMKPKA